MSLGKVVVFAAGAVVGGVIGLIASKSPVVKKATKSTIKASLKAKDWTVDTFQKAKNEVTTMVKTAKKENKEDKVTA